MDLQEQERSPPGAINSSFDGAGSNWIGYAEHGSPVFLTWHRAFVALLEKSIRATSAVIAAQYPASLRDSYIQAANDLAWPYWDSAATRISTTKSLPVLIINKTVFVTGINGSVVEMRNPFFSYIWQTDWVVETGVGDVTAQKGQPTARYPTFTPSDVNGIPSGTNVTALISSMVTAQPLLHLLLKDLLFAQSWPCFGFFSAQNSVDSCPFGFAPLESPHSNVHLYAGGVNYNTLTSIPTSIPGALNPLETSSYDPLFYLHHANVDRIFATWQAFYPDVWITPGVSVKGTKMYPVGTPLSATTPLYPFKADKTGAWISSNDVRNTTELGYSYDNLLNTTDGSTLGPSQIYAKWVVAYPDISIQVAHSWRWFLEFDCIYNKDWTLANLDYIGVTSVDLYTTSVTSTNVSNLAKNPYFPSLRSISVNNTVWDPTCNQEGCVLHLLPGYNYQGAPFFVPLVGTVELTYTLLAAGINISTPAVNISDLSKGPASSPVDLSQLSFFCSGEDRSTAAQKAVFCQCKKKLTWLLDPPTSSPYQQNSGTFVSKNPAPPSLPLPPTVPPAPPPPPTIPSTAPFPPPSPLSPPLTPPSLPSKAYYVTLLSGSNVVPPVNTGIFSRLGTGYLAAFTAYVTIGTTLATGNITFTKKMAHITKIQICRGEEGTNGPVIVPIFENPYGSITAQEGRIRFTFDPSVNNISSAFRSSQAYLLISTAAYPNGAWRGAYSTPF